MLGLTEEDAFLKKEGTGVGLEICIQQQCLLEVPLWPSKVIMKSPPRLSQVRKPSGSSRMA